MATPQESKSTAELQIELRKLRKTVHELADAVDELSKQANSPQSSNASEKAQKVRDTAGDPVPEEDKIVPPSERE